MKLSRSLSERRNTVVRVTRSLLNKRGRLTGDERSRLGDLRLEMDQLEDDVHCYRHKRHAAAFRNWLRVGDGISPEEKRLMLEMRDLGTGNAGAYPGAVGGALFVPVQFNEQVQSALKFYGPMLDLGTIDDTGTGAPRAYPADNDTSISGEQVDEHAQGTAADVAGLVGPTLKAYMYSSKMVKCSIELVRDAPNFDAYLADRFAVRMARIVNQKFTNGVGTTEPYGIITQAAVGVTAAGASDTDGSSAANTVGVGDLASLEASVDVAYRKNAFFMLHPSTLASLRRVKDKQSRPVFPGLQSGGEDMIFNYPVATNPAMDELQSGPGSPPVVRKVVAFGDFAQYRIRRCPPYIQRLQQRGADFGQIWFLMLQRFDGNLMDGGGGAVKVLQTVF